MSEYLICPRCGQEIARRRNPVPTVDIIITITTVFVGLGGGVPQAADDAREVAVFPPEALPRDLAFDHGRILADYLAVRQEWRARAAALPG
ncbi:MAG: hypothetical protein FJ128_05790 [Deltaproteobacteria bacterium]|nr:hypothetical protein [Deltaproteobacteria bacterium]